MQLPTQYMGFWGESQVVSVVRTAGNYENAVKPQMQK
jgi:hypothetical protein